MRILHIISLALVASLFIGCQSEKESPFLITKDKVGKLGRNTPASDLEHIYMADSIVQDTTTITIGSTAKKVKIYEKGGKHLLTLTPNTDSIPTFENIRIYDSRFITENGIGLNSTFKDIKDKYTVQKIITSINNVVILIKDHPVYFTIDKQELPSNLRYGTQTVEAVQIPDAAKIKYMMVGWD